MAYVRRKLGPVLACLIFLVGTAASAANASDLGPKGKKLGQGKGHGGRTIHSVAEPAAIALLGVGLITLGIYARRKRSRTE